MSLNKTRLAQAIAEQSGLSKNRSAKAMAAILEEISRSVASGSDVKIAGFGKFYPQTLTARMGRHPKTGDALRVPARRTVRFKCYKQLRDRLNGGPATVGDPKQAVGVERRREFRINELPQGKAVIRISGIPVCEFEIKDVSGNGTSILVAENSMVLRNLRVGQDIELHMVYKDGSNKATLQRSKIAHITPQSKSDIYPGYVMVGMQILDTLSIH